jgi:hypothetical protein
MADSATQLVPTSPEQSAQQNADAEVTAIANVNTALVGLDPAVQHRVLRWANDRFGLPVQQTQQRKQGIPTASAGGEEEENGGAAAERTFADFASLYNEANPDTEADKALVAAYWLQVVQGNGDWTGFSANKELKHMGHGTDNITEAPRQLIDSTPHYVLQTHKSGKARQARKKYKLTNAGIRKVEQMISGDGEGGGNVG